MELENWAMVKSVIHDIQEELEKPLLGEWASKRVRVNDEQMEWVNPVQSNQNLRQPASTWKNHILDRTYHLTLVFLSPLEMVPLMT